MDNFRRRPRQSLDGFVPRKQPTILSPNNASVSRTPKKIAPSPSQPSIAPLMNNPVRRSLPQPVPGKHALRPHEQPKQKKRWKKIALRSSMAMGALVLILGGFFGLSALHNLNKIFHGNILGDAQALFSNTKLKGEDQGRVNVLLAGNSADDVGHDGASLTDSIMIVSIDTRNHQAFMLSIPRDLWVNVSGSHQKINAAYANSTFNRTGYPHGGMGQLEQVVQEQIGIPIQYYGLIDYSAFKDSVNAVGGITVNIQSTDKRGLYDPNINKQDGGPLRLSNGSQNLNGQTALNLARARGDPTPDGRVGYGFPNSDFDRTTHQRQMLTALAQKSSSAGVLSNPIKVSQLFNSLGKNVSTDMSLSDVMRFIQVTKGMDPNTIQSLGLTNDGQNPLVGGYSAPNGQSALIPKAGVDDFSEIRAYYQRLTSDSAVVKENPKIVVLNSTAVDGLGRKEANALSAKGFTPSAVASLPRPYDTTMIVDKTTNNGKSASRTLLQQLFSLTVTPSTSTSPQALEAKNYNADFVIILGKNSSNL